MAEREPLRTDPLFVALTRPPMFLGLPYDFATAIFFVTVFTFIATASFWVFVLAIPLFIAGRVHAERDPHFMALMITRFLRCPKSRNHRWWGGTNSYEP